MNYYAAQQFSIATMESALPANTAKPATYALAVQTSFSGEIQHLVWNTKAGAITNMSTCSTGLLEPAGGNNQRRSSLVAGYPSTVIVNSFGSATDTNSVIAWTGDGSGNTFLGGPSGPSALPLASNGALFLGTKTLEAAFPTKPTGVYWYSVIFSNSSGSPPPWFLENIVTSQPSGVIDDLTARCHLY